jgi:aminopeptidase N
VDAGFALENQTRPVYSPVFWEFGGGDDVVVHEIAHQWYGDHVAVEQWDDIWLNEGFASYAEWMWHEHEGIETAQEVFDFFYEATPPDDPFWELEIGDPGPDQLFDEPVYVRGAMTLHALRTEVGDRAFFRILRTWAAGDGNGSTAEFVALAERVSGSQLDDLFEAWLFTGSRPDVAATADGRGRGSATQQGVGAGQVPLGAKSMMSRLAHTRHPH